MIAQYVQDGRYVDYIPGADVAVGEVVVQGDLVGVAVRAIPAGTVGPLAVQGVFDIAKATGGGTGITAGALTYWDGASSKATATAEGHKLIGKSIRAAGDNDATVRVRLSQ